MNFKISKVFFIVAVIVLGACSKKQTTVPSPDVPTINGVAYPTVKIGSQRWTTINYNGPGGVNYERSEANSAVYGKFYTRNEAVAISLPPGWRIPTFTDWNKLISTLGGTPLENNIRNSNLPATVVKSLMSNADWSDNGTNSSSFNAYPAGVYGDKDSPAVPQFTEKGSMADFISSSVYFNGETVNFFIRTEFDHTLTSGFGGYLISDKAAASIRFVKDE